MEERCLLSLFVFLEGILISFVLIFLDVVDLLGDSFVDVGIANEIDVLLSFSVGEGVHCLIGQLLHFFLYFGEIFISLLIEIFPSIPINEVLPESLIVGKLISLFDWDVVTGQVVDSNVICRSLLHVVIVSLAHIVRNVRNK